MLERLYFVAASSGIKANLQRFYGGIPSKRIDSQPVPGERNRLYGLLAWFHAVVQERLRYTPIGSIPLMYRVIH